MLKMHHPQVMRRVNSGQRMLTGGRLQSRGARVAELKGSLARVDVRVWAQLEQLDLVDELTGLPVATASSLNPEAG